MKKEMGITKKYTDRDSEKGKGKKIKTKKKDQINRVSSIKFTIWALGS